MSAPVLRILLVDDDRVDRLAIRRHVRSEGLPYELHEAGSRAEAVEKLREATFDVVLLDYLLGDGTGLELLPDLEATPAILLTGAGNEQIAVEAMQQGAHDYLVKDVDRNYLTILPTTIANVVARHQAEEARRTAEQSARQHAAELEQANRALEESRAAAEAATRSKSQFLANMSHEIRTPLTAVLGFADILLERVVDQTNLDAAQTIKRNGEHLLDIINDILDLSRIEAGKFQICREPCSVVKLIGDVMATMQVRADAKSLPLSVEYDGPIPDRIHSDPTRLRQILINLLANAIKFTEVGRVRLIVRTLLDSASPPRLQFEVIDTGIGMTAEQLDRVFRPFTQATMESNRQFGGTGLGLTICKRLAELLGGEITVDSELGKGSTFRATIAAGPLDPKQMHQIDSQEDAPRQTAQTPAAKELPRIDAHILLAEDGHDNQRLISFLLQQAGATVTLAENGQVAFDLATAGISDSDRCNVDRAEPVDLILMDIQMPVMDGYEATRRLREAGFHNPIVALTAHAMKGDCQQCIDAGCDGYLAKPIDRNRLIETVARRLAKAAEAHDQAPLDSV